MSEQAQQNNFKAEILEVIQEINISNTQMIRTLLVRDPDLGIKVSLQKWWRPDSNGEWVAGKGFMLNGKECLQLSKSLEKVGKRIAHFKN